MIPDQIKKIAEKEGYSFAGYAGEWKGNKVYIPYNSLKGEETSPINQLDQCLVILQKGGKCWTPAPKEAFRCLVDLYPDRFLPR